MHQNKGKNMALEKIFKIFEISSCKILESGALYTGAVFEAHMKSARGSVW